MFQIKKLIEYLSKQAREKRAAIFRNTFSLDENTKILDLGSENGANIHAVLKGTRVRKNNVYIADIDSYAVAIGSKIYGFIPVVISESGKLPFKDKTFDIVYCSSVIEHVTINKNIIWSSSSGYMFRTESLARQQKFSNEIKRVGKQYFIQTPYKYFPIESHSWLPFVGWFPRRLLIPTLHITNLFWIKKTSPDWYLMNKKDMHNLFDDAEILSEKVFGLTKSIIAVKAKCG